MILDCPGGPSVQSHVSLAERGKGESTHRPQRRKPGDSMAEIRGMQQQAQEYQQPLEAGRGQEPICSRAPGQNTALRTPGFQPSNADFEFFASVTKKE